MADSETSLSLPTPTPEQLQVARGQFQRAKEVLASKKNPDYAIQLLLTCCQIEPANLVYRKELRKIERNKFNNNLKGSSFAFLSNSPQWTRIKSAKRSREYLKVLEIGEKILVHNPWDVGAQMDMAEAADAIGMLDVAVWILEQARHKDQMDATVNRALARLYEKRGNYRHAMHLWELVRKKDPSDIEAQHKAKDLAVSETIARGHYGEAVGLKAAESGPVDAAEVETASNRAVDAKTPKEQQAQQSGPVIRPNTGTSRIHREVAQLRLKLDAEPTNPLLYLQLASCYRKHEQFDHAREVLQSGLGPTGNHFEIVTELAEVDIEPFRQNLAIVEDKLKADPQDDDLRKNRIRLLKEINTRELELFRRKADRFPTELGHRFELGVRLLRAGQTDEAIKELQSARSDPKHHYRSLFYLGHCFKSRNNWRLAQRNFEEVLQNLPPNEEAMKKEAMFQLACGCAESGDIARAIELAFELANMDFAYKNIGKLLDEWQRKQQAGEDA